MEAACRHVAYAPFPLSRKSAKKRSFWPSGDSTSGSSRDRWWLLRFKTRLVLPSQYRKRPGSLSFGKGTQASDGFACGEGVAVFHENFDEAPDDFRELFPVVIVAKLTKCSHHAVQEKRQGGPAA